MFEIFFEVPEFKSLKNCLGVSSKTWKAYEQGGSHLVYFWKVGGDSLSLDTIALVRGYSNTILPLHGDHGTSIIS